MLEPAAVGDYMLGGVSFRSPREMYGTTRRKIWALALGAALSLGAAAALAALPAGADARSKEAAKAKGVLEADGYSVIAILGSDDQLVTASVRRGGEKSIVDVDPMTGIVLPHITMPPIPAQLAPITGLPANPR